MSTRASGFARVPAELYQTPAWVVDALAEHVNLNGLAIWEPACGEGQMVRALEAHGAHVTATDLMEHGFEGQADVLDFTDELPAGVPMFFFDSIITNPPYGQGGRTAVRFIERGLERLPPGGLMAMLLSADFDSGSTRAHIFGACRSFAGKVTLRRRIEWFPPEPGQAGPSANHAWFIWERSHLRRGASVLYAPNVREAA